MQVESNPTVAEDPDASFFLRIPAHGPGESSAAKVVEKQQEEQSPDEEAFILCRQCGQAITRPRERIEVQGAHRHTFANPHGLVFEIGCFKNAMGCGYAGQPTDEFTWFAGYLWRICFCAACLTHLGWVFSSPGGSAFHGLILDRLIEPVSS